MKNKAPAQKIIMRKVCLAAVISVIGMAAVGYIVVRDAMNPKKDLVTPPRIEAEEIPKVLIKEPGK